MKNHRPSTASEVIHRVLAGPGPDPSAALGHLFEKYKATSAEVEGSPVILRLCLNQAMEAVMEVARLGDVNRTAEAMQRIVATKLMPAFVIGVVLGREIEKGEDAKSKIILPGDVIQ